MLSCLPAGSLRSDRYSTFQCICVHAMEWRNRHTLQNVSRTNTPGSHVLLCFLKRQRPTHPTILVCSTYKKVLNHSQSMLARRSRLEAYIFHMPLTVPGTPKKGNTRTVVRTRMSLIGLQLTLSGFKFCVDVDVVQTGEQERNEGSR